MILQMKWSETAHTIDCYVRRECMYEHACTYYHTQAGVLVYIAYTFSLPMYACTVCIVTYVRTYEYMCIRHRTLKHLARTYVCTYVQSPKTYVHTHLLVLSNLMEIICKFSSTFLFAEYITR